MMMSRLSHMNLPTKAIGIQNTSCPVKQRISASPTKAIAQRMSFTYSFISYKVYLSSALAASAAFNARMSTTR